ncbi:hypothetical protein PF010_g8678 [Phytophthora fragariae]|nr:hypothetical protein PF011_g6255 [Phytophthora fragariae]KAE9117228.1 hypothetical protein PF010_g8678 [Phytophthora fragariae]KAE9350130.1 hypothetical protein PF008_g6580 [Phytophthora fragariae]
MRGDNAQLMEANLSLLMEIREADTVIDALRLKLRAQCDAMEKCGIPVPGNFTELLAPIQLRPTPSQQKR